LTTPASLSRAVGEPISALPLNSWETWLCAIFLLLVGVAVIEEMRR
jgi:hypothetical protein